MKFAGRITIKKLKTLNELVFEVPKAGLFLLCGANGTGKSSLLACLHRIGFPNAFPDAFRTSRVSALLDSFSDTEITYSVGARSVKYIYGGQRWVPNPRKNASVLNDFGFSSVLHIGANAARIEPRPEDFKPNRVKDASNFIRAHAKTILDSEKFGSLKVVNVKRGMTNAFLLPIQSSVSVIPSKQLYFSERNFSLGELCVLKLLRSLETCGKGALLLIDEIELALHPTAQVRLLSVLERISDEKKLTVLVATHSVSLINAVERTQLLQLVRNGNDVECVSAPYHGAAIGAVTPTEERHIDCVFAVEDDKAATIARAILASLMEQTPLHARAAVQVIPIGPFDAVMKFVRNSSAIVAAKTRVFALIDKDVETETLASWHANGNFAQLQLSKDIAAKLRYLPWTPEVGIAKRFKVDKQLHLSELRKLFGNTTKFDLNESEINKICLSSGSVQRGLAKTWINALIHKIASVSLESVPVVEQKLLTYFASADFQVDEAYYKQLFLPLLNAK